HERCAAAREAGDDGDNLGWIDFRGEGWCERPREPLSRECVLVGSRGRSPHHLNIITLDGRYFVSERASAAFVSEGVGRAIEMLAVKLRKEFVRSNVSRTLRDGD